jgi:hypothetical protein
MQIAQLPKLGLTFPDVCPCCQQRAGDALTLSRTKAYPLLVVTVYETESLDVPYCGPCKRHILWHQEWGMLGTLLRAGLVALLSTFLALIPIGFIWLLVRHPAILALAIIPGLLAGLVSLRKRLRLRPASPTDSRHARKTSAVEFLGANEDSFFLAVHSPIFLRTLLGAVPGAQTLPGPIPGQPSRTLLLVAVVVILLFVVLLATGYMQIGVP